MSSAESSQSWHSLVSQGSSQASHNSQLIPHTSQFCVPILSMSFLYVVSNCNTLQTLLQVFIVWLLSLSLRLRIGSPLICSTIQDTPTDCKSFLCDLCHRTHVPTHTLGGIRIREPTTNPTHFQHDTCHTTTTSRLLTLASTHHSHPFSFPPIPNI